MEIGYDVKAALAACVLPADESRLKEVQSGTQNQSSVEKRGLTKAIVVNFICVIIYGQGFNKMDLESRTQCLMAVMDEKLKSAKSYAIIKFATVQHASMPQDATKTCRKRKHKDIEKAAVIVIDDSSSE